MNKEELIKELKKSRRQTKDERYEYINSHFNQTSYAMRLEKYARELYKENKELEEDLKFVLEQVLGAFVQNWCIDWNFNDIRKKYNISDKYDWNSDVDE